ncbi:hypothetical protein V6N11_032717 [Hibiscus sabdariffa]|uniref:Uncharacterized protein n=1 Tax=Hibiscus sabdariffa TaxID=183260 RepID=A0ABR2T1G7_9ROSI
MKAVAYTWMLLSMCLLGHRLIVFGEANEAQVLGKFLKSRLSKRPSPTVHFPARFDVNTWRSSDYIQPQDGSMETDKISALPGQSDGVDFDHYSGYVTVDSKAGRALFYYFAESPQNSSTNPLVLWFNGGPGYSSLMGAMTELGPFRVNSDGETLFRNNYAWNNVANVIFVESPVGAGFSYSNTTSDYQNTGDKSTEKDAYIFLLNWLERFPQYKSRELYITDVQTALHANVTAWDLCNDSIYRHWTDSAVTILPVIKNLMTNGIKVCLYSGDVDSIVPITSTRYVLNKLKLPIKTVWRPWTTDDEVGGYVMEYEGLTLVTVRDAGHEVPSYQPARALTMISSFLGGASPPL